MSGERKSVAVIGGGIVGLAIGWRAAQQGCAVSVFDQSRMGSEASWAGAGMLAPGGEVECASDFARQLVQARSSYPSFLSELTAESGREIEFQANGALEVAYSDAESTAMSERSEMQRGLGIASKLLDLKSVRAFWPRVQSDALVAARFVPGDAILDPRAVVAALLEACRQRRVMLHEGERVAGIEVSDGTAVVNGQSFDRAIVAAGAWSSEIEVQGVPALPRSEPVRGHLIGYRQPTETLTTIVRHGHHYFLQRANGLLIAGASVEHAGWQRSIDAEVVRGLERAAARVLPHLGETTPSEVWNGFRPGAERLHMGPWHAPELLLAYGHFRNGILLAPTTAERITALL